MSARDPAAMQVAMRSVLDALDRLHDWDRHDILALLAERYQWRVDRFATDGKDGPPIWRDDRGLRMHLLGLAVDAYAPGQRAEHVHTNATPSQIIEIAQRWLDWVCVAPAAEPAKEGE